MTNSENYMQTEITSQAPLGQLLLRRGVLSQNQLSEALRHQQSCSERKLIGEVLVELGYVDERGVLETLAEAYGNSFCF